MMKKSLPLLFALFVLLSCNKASDNSQNTPLMGWSSWNTYRINISDSLIMRQADAMVESGLKDAGYEFINIDDGFFGGRDYRSGKLKIHPSRFPHGLKPVVDHIHSLGLKAGIYSDAGLNTCGNYCDNDTIAVGVGLYGHEKQDAQFYFKDLGIDFIKIDFCGAVSFNNSGRLSMDPQKRYTDIRKAIDEVGRKDVRMNVCRWNYPGTWVSDVASSWRISQDITPQWNSVKDIIGQNLYLSAYAVNGRYNDMDMLEVGRTLSEEEDRTHFGMWCMMCSPLLIGCDLTTLKAETLSLLTNLELIALNQDPLHLQAYVVSGEGGRYILVKDIEKAYSPVRAVAFYNSEDAPAHMRLQFEDVQLGGKVKVRDLYERVNLPDAKGGYMDVEVPAHGCRLYRLEAQTRDERKLYEAETAYMTSYQELYNPLAVGTAYYAENSLASGGMVASNLGYGPRNDIRWRVYSKKGGDYVLTLTLFPKEGGNAFVSVADSDKSLEDTPGQEFFFDASNGARSYDFPVKLQAGENIVRLYSDLSRIPDVDYLLVNRK